MMLVLLFYSNCTGVFLLRNIAARCEKNGSNVACFPLLAPDADLGELLAIHEMLDSLSNLHPRHADVVKLRYFVGCTFDEIGEIQGRSADSARDDWVFARAWLKREWTRGDHRPTN